ncbi:hypothetical protein HRTV-25_gp111 [Halorubrum tailed virus 25]|uniref:Uncharacterized protein n=1 Tax=Halorubrum tailed virus 25 TaxID=2878006 RepID=A0AAE8XYN3_9CAUD|nr:hypothetical protein M1M37_gp111 [Halorubrum tailed virus 25]UBF22692.1 hypothetical protein HRTV-25_gp111 [Halorubrum tailed virus 25]
MSGGRRRTRPLGFGPLGVPSYVVPVQVGRFERHRVTVVSGPVSSPER